MKEASLSLDAFPPPGQLWAKYCEWKKLTPTEEELILQDYFDVNENKDLCDENRRYVMRITGSDSEGQDQLDNFIDPESKYPVVVTTSRLLSTGVDAQIRTSNQFLS